MSQANRIDAAFSPRKLLPFSLFKLVYIRILSSLNNRLFTESAFHNVVFHYLTLSPKKVFTESISGVDVHSCRALPSISCRSQDSAIMTQN